MKKLWLVLIVILAIAGFWISQSASHKSVSQEKPAPIEAKGENYWTCAMHPQVHLDHAGECPICHMRLIQVKGQDTKVQETHRATLRASPDQLAQIGVQKQQVERMDINISIPVAGRLLSSSSVAFQVYESDLKYIKTGLSFKGTSSLSDEAEITGKIVSVDSIVDPTSRTVRVVGSIQKGPKGLISETTFSGVIVVQLKDRVAIPESSVLHTGTGDLVYLVQDENQLKAQPVKLGLKAEGFYEVLSGLEPGAFISSGPNFLIDSEAKIRGSSEPANGEGKSSLPACAGDQHWDVPMSMCMPGQARK